MVKIHVESQSRVLGFRVSATWKTTRWFRKETELESQKLSNLNFICFTLKLFHSNLTQFPIFLRNSSMHFFWLKHLCNQSPLWASLLWINRQHTKPIYERFCSVFPMGTVFGGGSHQLSHDYWSAENPSRIIPGVHGGVLGELWENLLLDLTNCIWRQYKFRNRAMVRIFVGPD